MIDMKRMQEIRLMRLVCEQRASCIISAKAAPYFGLITHMCELLIFLLGYRHIKINSD